MLARVSLPAQCARISWVCLDINSHNVRARLAPHLGNDITRGFDTITFSYSLSMIPEWEKALQSAAKKLMSIDGRLIVADFDSYTEQSNSFKDLLIKTWYAQDGVCIEAKTRQVLTNTIFASDKYAVTVSRSQRPALVS